MKIKNKKLNIIFTPYLILKKSVLDFSHFQSLKKNYFFSFVNNKLNSKNSSKNTQIHSQTYCLSSFDVNKYNAPLFTRIHNLNLH